MRQPAKIAALAGARSFYLDDQRERHVQHVVVGLTGQEFLSERLGEGHDSGTLVEV